MKCNKCGYEINQENEFCPNCGTKVESDDGKIECLHCHYRMEAESNFCPSCGKSVITDDSKCKYCGYGLEEDNQFCPNCGKSTTQEERLIEQPIEKKTTGGYIPIGQTQPVTVTPNIVKEEKKEYVSTPQASKDDNPSIWKNPILWIVSISLLIICILISQYIQSNPSKKSSSSNTPKTEERIPNEDLKDLKITGDTYSPIVQTNIHAGGMTYIYDDKLYIGYDGSIYEMNLDFTKSKKVVDEYGEYIYVDNEYIYYCDEDNNYIRFNRETNQEEELLKSVYYPQMIDGNVYYQADGDGETIHSFNLETKEDKKINNERSYAITVDTHASSQTIYYLNGDSNLCKISIDGMNAEVVVNDINGYVQDGGIIYYISERGIGKVDATTKEDTIIDSKETGNYISLLDEKIVYGGYYDGVYIIDKDGKNKKTITTNSISNLEVQGNMVIYIDVRKEAIYGANKDGERMLIQEIDSLNSYYKEEDIEGIPGTEGFQDF